MNDRSFIRRKLFGCAVIVAVLGLVVGGSSCSQPGQLSVQPATAGAPGQMKTVAVVAINSYENMMADVNFVGSLAGMAGADQIVQAGFLSAIGDNGLAAIDKTKPWGVILQTDGASFSLLGVLPITKPDDLLAILKTNGIPVNEGQNGVSELSLPNGLPVYIKPQAGWTMIGASPAAFAHLPENFQADLTRLVTEYDFAAAISVQQVPEMYRQLVGGWMRGGAQQAMKRPDESDEQFALRQQAAEGQIKEIEQLLADAANMTLGFAVDGKQQRGYVDMIVEAKPDTRLAKQLTFVGEPRTNFAGFYQADAAATITFVNQMDPATVKEYAAQTRANMDVMRQQLNSAIDSDPSIPAGMRDAVKETAVDFAELLLATMETGKLDGGASLRLRPDALTFVGGAKAKNPESIVNSLKKLEAAGKQSTPSFPGVQWNAAEHAGVTFHTLNMPLPNEADEAIRRMVGEQFPIAVGIGPDAVYLAVGRDNLEAVKKAIDASQKEANKLVPPFEVAFSLGPIFELAAAHTKDESLRPVLQTVAATLQNDAQGRDHVRMVGQMVPNGVRYRFEAEEGALRAIGQAALIARMQGIGQ
ncbi:MAG: hypothetical protein WD669_09685 [Pirellulales bacterium]